MAQHSGKIEDISGSNVRICGKEYFVPSDKKGLLERYPVGTAVNLVEVKGTVSTITPLNGDQAPATTKADPSPVPPSTPAGQPQPIKEAIKEPTVPPRQTNGFKDSDRIGWQALLNTAVNIIDPSWRDDPHKSIQENVSARLELVKATATGLHAFINENLNGGCSCQK